MHVPLSSLSLTRRSRTPSFSHLSKPVNFYIDGKLRRTVDLYRPLQDMQLHLSVWTTTGK